MVIKKVNLDIVIGVTSQVPETDLPEVAFAGKSNVGKSSLINALMNRKSYARTSSQPGKTQTINYYNINDAMLLVDLPGYGYANVSQSVKEKLRQCCGMRRCRVSSPRLSKNAFWGLWMEPKSRMSCAVALVM